VIAVPRLRLPEGEDPRFQPHVLVLRDPGDGFEKEWEIEHPDACPQMCAWWPEARQVVEEERRISAATFGLIPPWPAGDYDCYVRYELVNNGLDSLDIYSLEGDEHFDHNHVATSRFEAGWHRLRPGRYVIEGWFTPFYWAGSEPCDADGGLTLVRREGD
jgi:hypothetical protein